MGAGLVEVARTRLRRREKGSVLAVSLVRKQLFFFSTFIHIFNRRIIALQNFVVFCQTSA